MNTVQDIKKLQCELQDCKKLLTALGDETRQHMLYSMLSSKCSGMRVVDIAKTTNLSRPAVSHHMQILKESGIVKFRKEGTLVYYYLEPEISEIDKMLVLLSDIKKITENLPDRSGNE